MHLWAFWWCVDDHLAAALNVPELGSLPFWVVLLISLGFGQTTISFNNR
jgi:hypothetical protein